MIAHREEENGQIKNSFLGRALSGSTGVWTDLFSPVREKLHRRMRPVRPCLEKTNQYNPKFIQILAEAAAGHFHTHIRNQRVAKKKGGN